MAAYLWGSNARHAESVAESVIGKAGTQGCRDRCIPECQSSKWEGIAADQNGNLRDPEAEHYRDECIIKQGNEDTGCRRA